MPRHTKKRCGRGAISQQCAAASSTGRCSASRRCESGWSARCVRRAGQPLLVGAAAIVAVVWLGFSLDALPFLHRPTQVATQVAEVRETDVARRNPRRARRSIATRLRRHAAKCAARQLLAATPIFAVAHDSDAAVHRVDRRRTGPRRRHAVRDSPAQRRRSASQSPKAGRRVADRCGRRGRASCIAAKR